MQILSSGIIKQALLGKQFREFQRAIERRLEFGDLLVNCNRFYGKTIGGVCVAHLFEIFDRAGVVANASVEIANRIQDGQVPRVGLQYLFVLRNGILELALLDVLFGRGKRLLLAKSKPENHRMPTPFSRPSERSRCSENSPPTAPPFAGDRLARTN